MDISALQWIASTLMKVSTKQNNLIQYLKFNAASTAIFSKCDKTVKVTISWNFFDVLQNGVFSQDFCVLFYTKMLVPSIHLTVLQQETIRGLLEEYFRTKCYAKLLRRNTYLHFTVITSKNKFLLMSIFIYYCCSFLKHIIYSV